jgi:hypothetical protein
MSFFQHIHVINASTYSTLAIFFAPPYKHKPAGVKKRRFYSVACAFMLNKQKPAGANQESRRRGA